MPIPDTLLLDPNKVLDRIKHQLAIRYDKDLAEYLGITPTSLSNQRALRAGLDFEAIILRCSQINLNWIFFGDETLHPPFPKFDPIATGMLAAHSDEVVMKLREVLKILESNKSSGGTIP